MTPRGQNCARRAQFRFSALCPLAPTPFDLATPNLVHGCSLTSAARCMLLGVGVRGARAPRSFEFVKLWANDAKIGTLVQFNERSSLSCAFGRWGAGCTCVARAPRSFEFWKPWASDAKIGTLVQFSERSSLPCVFGIWVAGCTCVARATRSFKIVKLWSNDAKIGTLVQFEEGSSLSYAFGSWGNL